ncbi:MAG: SH3 domain-containing protein [Anaerolineae bacterium]
MNNPHPKNLLKMSRPVVLVTALMVLIIAALAVTASPAEPGLQARAQATFPTLPVNATNTPGTPTVVPTFTNVPAPTQVGCGTPLNLIPGSLIVVTGGLNIRASASLSAPLITYFSEERRARLIGGPVCADGFIWWQITGFGGDPGANMGWVIQGSRDGRIYLQPAIIAPSDPCYFPLEFAVNDTIVALTGVRLRNAPTQSSYTVSVVPYQATMTVLEGPACRDGINWWRVSTSFQTSGVPVEGWIAEGFPGEYYVASYDQVYGTVEIPCVLPLTLGVGSHIAVNYRDGVPRRLRAEPNVNAPITLEMPDEIALEIIGGPVCSNSYQWWQVRVISTNYVGWIAEGRPGRYNIEIIAP